MNNISKSVSGSSTTRQKIFSHTPYNINFDLNVYAKSQDDALQIVEQVFPFFTPQYTVTVKPFSNITDLTEDVTITLTGTEFADDFEGAMEQRRTIIYSLDFEMKLSYHGPIANTSVIRQVDAKVFDIKAGLNDSDIGLETIRVTPNPTSITGMPDSDFGFTTTILDSAS